MWMVEWAELDGMSRADASRVKTFVTSPSDHFRAAYAHKAESHPRQCVFVGTTNEDRYLKDATGGGRFWPVRCRAIDRAALERDVGQLWAEATRLFDSGATWWPDEAFFELARAEQDERYQEDPWEEPVRRWLAEREMHARGRGVTTHDVLTLSIGVEKSRLSRADEIRVGEVLRRLGWTDVRREREGAHARRRVYYKSG
jgi:putative DNA primase/helicase